MSAEPNPYSAPQANLELLDGTTSELASRGLRLGGSIIDAILVMSITVPTMWFTGAFQDAMAGRQQPFAEQVAWAAFGFAAFMLVHGYMLYRNGQTLAKRLLGMKIVDLQGGKPPFLRLAGLRYLLPHAIYLVPVAGPIIALVGVLLIFRADRRCMHDHFAGTRVVMVR